MYTVRINPKSNMFSTAVHHLWINMLRQYIAARTSDRFRFLPRFLSRKVGIPLLSPTFGQPLWDRCTGEILKSTWESIACKFHYCRIKKTCKQTNEPVKRKDLRSETSEFSLASTEVLLRSTPSIFPCLFPWLQFLLCRCIVDFVKSFWCVVLSSSIWFTAQFPLQVSIMWQAFHRCGQA